MSQWLQLATLIITLLSLSATLGFWFGVFKQFKDQTEKRFDRLEALFFNRSISDVVPPATRETANQQSLVRSTS